MRFCLSTMKGYPLRFNLFLALAILLLPFFGCQSMEKDLGMKKDEPTAAMRVHIELPPENAGEINVSQTISLMRADPVQVSIDKDAILTEANLLAAKLINTPAAPAVEVRFEDKGAWILEQYSAANPGRHFVIYGQWGTNLNDGRWIAAPLISHRIKDGVMSFTPDMSKKEVDDFVKGLNNAIKQDQTGSN
jgi:hypothetical protein